MSVFAYFLYSLLKMPDHKDQEMLVEDATVRSSQRFERNIIKHAAPSILTFWGRITDTQIQHIVNTLKQQPHHAAGAAQSSRVLVGLTHKQILTYWPGREVVLLRMPPRSLNPTSSSL